MKILRYLNGCVDAEISYTTPRNFQLLSKENNYITYNPEKDCFFVAILFCGIYIESGYTNSNASWLNESEINKGITKLHHLIFREENSCDTLFVSTLYLGLANLIDEQYYIQNNTTKTERIKILNLLREQYFTMKEKAQKEAEIKRIAEKNERERKTKEKANELLKMFIEGNEQTTWNDLLMVIENLHIKIAPRTLGFIRKNQEVIGGQRINKNGGYFVKDATKKSSQNVLEIISNFK